MENTNKAKKTPVVSLLKKGMIQYSETPVKIKADGEVTNVTTGHKESRRSSPLSHAVGSTPGISPGKSEIRLEKDQDNIVTAIEYTCACGRKARIQLKYD